MRPIAAVALLAITSCNANKTQAEGVVSNATTPSGRIAQNPRANHNAITPGEQVGPLRQDTTREDLAERLGEQQLKDQDVDIGEGQVRSGTVIHADTDHELRAVWQSPARQTLVLAHVVGSAWELPGGLHPGASFSEVERVLGRFQFHGLVGDNSGFIEIRGTQLAAYAHNTSLRLVADPNDPPCQSPALRAEQLASVAPEVQACSLTLGDVIVRF